MPTLLYDIEKYMSIWNLPLHNEFLVLKHVLLKMDKMHLTSLYPKHSNYLFTADGSHLINFLILIAYNFQVISTTDSSSSVIYYW